MEIDVSGFVNLGDVCRDILGMQCQYGSRYADSYFASPAAKEKGERTPYLGEGLAIIGDPGNYHFMKIHRDSVDAFVARVVEHKVANYVWSQENGQAALNRLAQIVYGNK